MILRGNLLTIIVQLLTILYATYVFFTRLTSVADLWNMDSAAFWPFIALVWVLSDLVNTQRIIQFENYIEYCQNEARKMLHEAIKEKEKFDKRNKK